MYPSRPEEKTLPRRVTIPDGVQSTRGEVDDDTVERSGRRSRLERRWWKYLLGSEGRRPRCELDTFRGCIVTEGLGPLVWKG